LENVDPQTLLYSLPTITDVLPAISSGSTKLGRDIYEIEKDGDWRQLEWFSVTHQLEIESVVRFAEENGLLLVNWVRAQAVQPLVVDYPRVLICKTPQKPFERCEPKCFKKSAAEPNR
jgi:hypothetical protein